MCIQAIASTYTMCIQALASTYTMCIQALPLIKVYDSYTKANKPMVFNEGNQLFWHTFFTNWDRKYNTLYTIYTVLKV